MTGSDKLIRDPLWETIRLDPTAVRIVDTAEFQRLRYIRQLGLAHLVYPGACAQSHGPECKHSSMAKMFAKRLVSRWRSA